MTFTAACLQTIGGSAASRGRSRATLPCSGSLASASPHSGSGCSRPCCTVVYSRNFSKAGAAPDARHFVFHRGATFQTAASDLGALNALLEDLTVVHVCDSMKPRGGDGCHKLLITSPDPAVWRWFVMKEFATTVFFPLFSASEMEALRAAEFGSTLAPVTMALRIRAWGMSTRAVFAPNQLEVGADVLKAISEKSLAVLQTAMSEISAASDTSHSLFVLRADRETLREGRVTFRSEAVARRVARLMAARERDALIAALQRLLGGSSTATVAGTTFAMAAIAMAAIDVLGRGGGEYTVRRLCDAPGAGRQSLPTRVVLPVASAVRSFGTLADLVQRCTAGELDLSTQAFAPRPPNLAPVDLIGPGLQVFLVLANWCSHDLTVTRGRSRLEGLIPLVRALIPLLAGRLDRPHLDVFFVVPEGCATAWGTQELVVSEPKASRALQQAVHPAAQPLPALFSEAGVDGGRSGFVLDGTEVEVRKSVLEVPLSVFREWLKIPARLVDDIDKAKAS